MVELYKEDTIFVSIASYRDPECHATLSDLFAKAKYPERVFVGVCQQNAPDDIDCMNSSIAQQFNDQIRQCNLEYFDAQGPMFARHLIEKHLFNNETFILQIDSHMMFCQNWDVECIKQLAMCDSDKPILTCYPPPYDRDTRILPPLTLPGSFLYFRQFHPRLGFTQQERRQYKTKPSKPLPSLFWAAGFSFTIGDVVGEVPYDPNCPFVFLGEEQSMSLRLFTHGYDFFSPINNIVHHLTTRKYRPTFWEQVYRRNCVVDEDTRQFRKTLEANGVERLQKIIAGQLEDPIYGLGHVRTIQQWEAFTGIDLKTKKVQRRAYFGLTAQPDAIETSAKQ